MSDSTSTQKTKRQQEEDARFAYVARERQGMKAALSDENAPTYTPVSSDDGFIQILSKSKREQAKQLIEAATKQPKSFDTLDFAKVDLAGADLKGLNLRALGENALRKINFAGADLSGQNFEGLNLQNARFKGARFEGTHFEGAKLKNADFTGAKFIRSNFDGAQAPGAHFDSTKFEGCALDGSFRGASFTKASLQNCIMGNADFADAKMQNSAIINPDNTGRMNFNGARMENTTFWGDFNGANFNSAFLNGANMDKGDFHEASFQRTRLYGISTSGAGLDAQAFKEAFANGSEDTPLFGNLGRAHDIPLPKPSLGSRYTLMKKLLRLQREAPSAKIDIGAGTQNMDEARLALEAYEKQRKLKNLAHISAPTVT